MQGDLPRACRLLRQSVGRFRRLGERHNLATGLAALGRVAQGQGDPATARARYLESLAVAQPLDAAPAAAPALEGLAALAAAEGQAAGAVRLLAAVDAIRPETAGAMPTSVLGQRERASCLESLRASLGPPAFARAWRQGHQAPPATAIARALQDAWEPDEVSPRSPQGPRLSRSRQGSPAPRGPAEAPPFAGALSAREQEVAALIAQGLTNRQLGERLCITPGTAANHVVHILNKLGLSARSQIAAWAVGQGLARPSPGGSTFLPAHVPLGAQ